MQNRIGLILIVTVLASFIMVAHNATAEVPKPQTPQFTIKLSNDKQYVELTIEKQSYSYSNGSIFNLYFNVRFKVHSDETWSPLYNYAIKNMIATPTTYAYFIVDAQAQENTNDHTIIQVPTVIANNVQLDFQVQTLVGHESQRFVPEHPLQPYFSGEYVTATAFVTSSDWSSIQTIKIPPSNPSTSNNDSQQPSTYLLVISIVLVAIAILLAIIVVLLHKMGRYRKNL